MANHSNDSKNTLFPALLKYWRGTRGLSQLDLGLAADVSARHVSFMETGRAKPSKEMVLTLGSTLQIPLREQNALLQAAGFDKEFDEPSFSMSMDSQIGTVLQLMLDKHEPYPMIIMDWGYDLLMSNKSASKMLMMFVKDPSAITTPINMFEMIFHPGLGRPFIVNWEKVARTLLARLHREALLKSHDGRLNNLINRIFDYPGIPESWRHPDFSQSSQPNLTVDLKKGDWEFSFLTTMTNFNAPQNVTLEELLIESYFPVDDKTEAACQAIFSSK